jgi:flagellar hook-associated protein 1 FlgK
MLAESIKHISSQLTSLREFTDRHVESNVTQINDIAEGIAQANVSIVELEVSGEEASELRDRRDIFLDDLSKLVNANVVERDSGSIAVFVGGKSLVDDSEVFPMETQQVPSGTIMVNDVVWENDTSSVRISSGEMSGLIDIRDNIIPALIDDLDSLAATLIDEVNNIHSTGYGSDGSTGLDFFTGSDASDIDVNTQIIGNVDRLAASATGEPGNNDIALALSELEDANVAPGTRTIGVFYSNMLEGLGAESRSTAIMKENSEKLLGYLEEQKESVAGVSLDEEAADLIRFQHAYQSAAQYMSVIDELMTALLNIA